MSDNENRYSITAVERGIAILDMFNEQTDCISIQDVCDALGVNTNMAFRLLKTLTHTGYLRESSKSGGYYLSLRVLKLSRVALQSLDIRKLAMPYLELLWTQFPKANVNMGMKNGDDIIMVDRVDGHQLPRTYFNPGKLIPFHCTGIGKVLCCSLSDDEIRAMVDRTGGLKAYTPNTITDVDVFIEELHKVRAEGVGRDRNEYIVDDNCSAVPIRDRNGKIVAAISTSALTPNMSVDEIEGTITKLKETANRINMILGFQSI